MLKDTQQFQKKDLSNKRKILIQLLYSVIFRSSVKNFGVSLRSGQNNLSNLRHKLT